MPKVTGTPTPRINAHNAAQTPVYLVLVMRWRHAGEAQVLRYSIKEKVDRKYWDARKHRAKFTAAHPEYVQLNRRLAKWEERAIRIWEQFDGKLTKEEFKLELDYIAGRKQRPAAEALAGNLQEYAWVFYERECEHPNARPNTVKMYKTWAGLLDEWAGEHGPTAFDDVSPFFLRTLYSWLLEQYAVSYARRTVKHVKTLMRAAAAEEPPLHANITYKSHSFRGDKSQIPRRAKVALTFDELDRLAELDLSGLPASYELARDLLLISAATALRFSDYSRLTPDMFFERDGHLLMEVRTQKTGALVVVPIPERERQILERYNFEPPRISDNTLRARLKEICKMAGIDSPVRDEVSERGRIVEIWRPKFELIGTHTGRRSFCTNYGRTGKFSTAELMAITGHTSEKQFFEYVGLDKYENALTMAAKIAELERDRRT